MNSFISTWVMIPLHAARAPGAPRLHSLYSGRDPRSGDPEDPLAPQWHAIMGATAARRRCSITYSRCRPALRAHPSDSPAAAEGSSSSVHVWRWRLEARWSAR
jgi:hypothetical protein